MNVLSTCPIKFTFTSIAGFLLTVLFLITYEYNFMSNSCSLYDALDTFQDFCNKPRNRLCKGWISCQLTVLANNNSHSNAGTVNSDTSAHIKAYFMLQLRTWNTLFYCADRTKQFNIFGSLCTQIRATERVAVCKWMAIRNLSVHVSKLGTA
jgi:hypothetical protein